MLSFNESSINLKMFCLSYGYHVSCNSYYLCYNKANIDKMFYRLRHYKDLASEEITVCLF